VKYCSKIGREVTQRELMLSSLWTLHAFAVSPLVFLSFSEEAHSVSRWRAGEYLKGTFAQFPLDPSTLLPSPPLSFWASAKKLTFFALTRGISFSRFPKGFLLSCFAKKVSKEREKGENSRAHSRGARKPPLLSSPRASPEGCTWNKACRQTKRRFVISAKWIYFSFKAAF